MKKITINEDIIFKVVIVLLILSSIGDLITTNLFLKTNILKEGNPFVEWAFNKFGFNSLILIKLSCVPIIFLISKIKKLYGAIFALPSVVIDTFATIHNTILLNIYG